MTDERKKMPKSPAPTTRAVDPCPTLIQISRTPWHCKITQHHCRARAYRACNRCGWGLFRHFISLVYLFSLLSPLLWETARYRLKYCLKGPLNTKQPINYYIRVSFRFSVDPANNLTNKFHFCYISWYI